jgi:glycosyltransferase involved in cell wall biosynthesis
VTSPRITVGLPIYKGADFIPKALDCLQKQTFGNFEAIISVDGGDEETADACRPFLVDPRFRMVVHPARLDWVGNFNWLLQQDLNEFFCYRQHDDTTAPDFFEVLLKAADKDPNAAAIYCDCQYFGGRNDIEIAPTIAGEPLERMLQYIERLLVTPVRGLLRSAAIKQAGLVRRDEFRAALQLHSWLAKVLCWGNFRRVARPLYYRLDHPHSFTSDYFRGSEDRKRAEWTTLFTGLLEAAMPICRTPQERLFFQQTIFERIVAYWNYHASNDRNSNEKLIAECLERLIHERNSHLLEIEERDPLLRALNRRVDEIKLLDRSRARKAIYQIHQRSRLAKLIFPKSGMRRIVFQIRQLYGMLKVQAGKRLAIYRP